MITSAPLRVEKNKKTLTELETEFTNQIAVQFIRQAQPEYKTELESLGPNLEKLKQQWQKNKEDCPVSNIETRIYWVLYILNCPKLIKVFVNEFEQKRIPREIFSDLYNKTFKNLNDPLLEQAFGPKSTVSLPSIKEFISQYARTILAKFFQSLPNSESLAALAKTTSIYDLFAASLSLAMVQIMDNPVSKKELCEKIFLTDPQKFKSAELLLLNSLEILFPGVSSNDNVNEDEDFGLNYKQIMLYMTQSILSRSQIASEKLLYLKTLYISQQEQDFSLELAKIFPPITASINHVFPQKNSEEYSRTTANNTIASIVRPGLPQTFFTTRLKEPRNTHVLNSHESNHDVRSLNPKQ